jgi:exoribonuclease R
MITAELMIESKHLLSEYVGTRKRLPLCYSVHEKPSKATKERLHRQLGALGVPNSVEQFDNASELTGIIYGLERMRGQAAQALKKDIIDHFLLRSSLSADNHGHYGLRLGSYAEWKPRDAAGIANQLQLAAVFGLHAPLSYGEMARRSNVLNEKRWKRDERTFSAILLESLYHKLSLVGSITTGTVTEIADGKVIVSMAGFSRLATLRGTESDSTLEVGAPIVGVFKGFNLTTKEYEFELA